ncbi:hypothetical protein IWQ61_000677 [Dispira simplex]|nr:hypothetical protein IWQ61_000677 [Dispira simplex]
MVDHRTGVVTLGILATFGSVCFLVYRWHQGKQTPRRSALRRSPHIRRRSRYANVPSGRPQSSRARSGSAPSQVNPTDHDHSNVNHPSTQGPNNTNGNELSGETRNIPVSPVQDQRIMDFLSAISEDQSRRDGYIHRGTGCDRCGVTPIRGIRYHCANCPDFDLCEDCEVDSPHPLNHVFLKIRIPVPTLCSPRTPLLRVMYPGSVIPAQTINMARINELHRRYDMNVNEIMALYDQFRVLARIYDDNAIGIDRATFYSCLGNIGISRSLIAQRTFSMYDQDQDELLSFEEMVFAIYLGTRANKEERIPLIFQGYDVDGDGYISREDLTLVFDSFLQVHRVTLRDVIVSVENMVLDSRRIQLSQPISAAFTSSIPEETEPLASSPPETDYVPPPIEEEPHPAIPQWPILQALSQNSVAELVHRTFSSVQLEDPDRISLEEFKACVQQDDRILNWFEILSPPF